MLFIVFCTYFASIMFFKLYSTMSICKYFKAKTFFFSFLCFKMRTWCFFFFFGQFLVYCSVAASGIKLHLTFCEQLTHTVWCCTKALCIIFVLLFSRLPLLSSEFIIWDHVLLTPRVLPWISFLYWVKRNLNELWCKKNKKHSGLLPTWPDIVTIKSLYRENAQAHSWWLIMT